MIALSRWALSSYFFGHVRRTALARYAGIVFLLSLISGCLSSEATIGVVDSPAIVQDAAPGRNGVAHLAQVRQVLQDNLNAVVLKLESYPDKRQAQEILQQAQMSLQQTLDAHEQQINAQLTDMLQTSVRECRDAKKLSMVVGKSAVLDYDPALDVSSDVLALFDKKNIQLPPMPALVTDPLLPAPNKPVLVKPAVEEKAQGQGRGETKTDVRTARKAEAKAAPKAERTRRAQKKEDKRRN